MNELAKLDFYNKEIAKIQQELFDKLDDVVVGLKTLNNTELLQLAKQIDFFAEMEQLGYSSLLTRTSKAYDDEIAKIFAELSRRELQRVPAASVEILRQLKDFELNYLTGSVRQYADQLKNAMLRGIVTGQTNIQIMNNLTTSFGVGTFISSSETSFLINDAFATFSNATRAKAYEQFPDLTFKYIGPRDDKTRDACKKVFAEIEKRGPLTIDEINALTIPGFQGFSRRGGYNCRHDFVRVR